MNGHFCARGIRPKVTGASSSPASSLLEPIHRLLPLEDSQRTEVRFFCQFVDTEIETLSQQRPSPCVDLKVLSVTIDFYGHGERKFESLF